MTYFAFLLVFILPPCLALLLLDLPDARRGLTVPGAGSRQWIWPAILLHVLLALAYTTPWDNYLVAAHVWSYEPRLVSGIVLGYVPLEEYIFFILETLLAGLWWRALAGRLAVPAAFNPSERLRLAAAGVLALAWLAALAVLISGWQPGTYLALILAWALPPVGLQLLAGADILWHARRLLALGILPLVAYLSTVDALAISSGTWTIDPAYSTGILIGALPLEEALFFLVTAVLIVFGLTLLASPAAHARMAGWRAWTIAGQLSGGQANNERVDG